MSCVTTPTTTQYSISTSLLQSTSLSPSVTTLPSTATTILISSCVTSVSGNATSSSCSDGSVVSTISGGQITTGIQVVITIPVTRSSPTATLFGTSCNGGDTSNLPSSTPSPSSSQSVSNGPSNSAASPIPTPISTTETLQSSSTLPGGSVTVIQQTTTLVQTPTQTSSHSGAGSVNTGAIAGGAAAGIAALAFVGFLLWFVLKRRKKQNLEDEVLRDDNFKPTPFQSSPFRRNEKGPDFNESRPYKYGALGTASPPVAKQDLPLTPLPTPQYLEYYNRRVGGLDPHQPVVAPVPRPTTSEGRSTSPRDESSASSSRQTDNSRAPLQLANPNVRSTVTYGDVKQRTVYLRAGTGYEIREPLASGSPAAAANPNVRVEPPSATPVMPAHGTQAHAGPSSSPFVHQDGGVVVPAATPPRVRPGKERADSGQQNSARADAPPAYEA